MTSKFIDKITNAKFIALIAHVKPDADSLGSCSAIYTYMLQLHKKVVFVCKTKEISKKFEVIPWVNKIKSDIPKGVDLVITCDVASKKRIGFDIDVDINIDHHSSNEKFANLNIVNPNAISTTEVVYDIFQSLHVKINPKIATALYCGLLDDSDMFSSSKVNGTTFALAKELINFGANHKSVVKYLQKYSTLSSLRLYGKMFMQMELLYNAEVALFEVSREILQQTGAIEEECEEALEKALELSTVNISILLVEKQDGGIKVSFRSDGKNVLDIASKFGGGGHIIRSGCDFKDKDINQVKKIILDEVKKIG